MLCRNAKKRSIVKHNHGQKSMRGSEFIFDSVDIESLLKKINTCHNNPEKSSSTKRNKYTPSAYSLFTHCSFHATKNKLDYYGRKDCMKNFAKV